MIERHIYEVIVVNHSTGEVISPILRKVATSSEAAMAKIDIQKICSDAGLTVDEVEYAILRLGSLRPVQEVSQTEVSKF